MHSTVTNLYNIIILYKESKREKAGEKVGRHEERIRYLSKKFIYYLKCRNVIEDFQMSEYKISIK